MCCRRATRRSIVATNGPSEELWHPARLISTAGIRSTEEQEQRATSALLAVMQAVPEFARALLADLGAPKGRVTTYAEVQLKDEDGKVSIPDGAIIVERGKTRWRTLVEVKTGPNELKAEQVGRYLDMARQHGFDAVLTISNQITGGSDEVPVPLDRRKIKRVDVRHLSWWRIMTEAIVQHRFRGVSDPDQAWILGELIAYLDNEKSGAGGFDDMGDGWVHVRDAVRQGTLRASDPQVRAVCGRWRQFMDYLALGLSQDLGRDVTPLRPRRQTAGERVEFLVGQLVNEARLSGGVRVPDAVAPVELLADLRARQVTTSVTLDAPHEGRALSRINWLLRQLREGDRKLRVEVGFVGTRETTSLLLEEATEYPQRLLSTSDAKREPRTFSLAMTRPMGLKRGKGQGSFVGDARRQLFDFYRDLVQDLKPWQAKAPKLPDERAEPEPLPQPEPPPFSAPDVRDPGEAAAPEDVRP
jgi:hypothetical protein